jgi:hypothetical protein
LDLKDWEKNLMTCLVSQSHDKSFEKRISKIRGKVLNGDFMFLGFSNLAK